MEKQYLIHNAHLNGLESFLEQDPHLAKLAASRYVYHSPLLEQLPIKIPGIYTLTGGGLVGKTTLMKQWMTKLLKQGVSPQSIVFYSGEVITDQEIFSFLLEAQHTS